MDSTSASASSAVCRAVPEIDHRVAEPGLSKPLCHADRCAVGHVLERSEYRHQHCGIGVRPPAGLHRRRVVATAHQRPRVIDRTEIVDEQRTGHGRVARPVQVPAGDLRGIGRRPFAECRDRRLVEFLTHVVNDTKELRNGYQDAWLATAIGAPLRAVKRRTKILPDNAYRVVCEGRDVGRRTNHGLRLDSLAQRVRGQVARGRSTWKEHVEPLTISGTFDLERQFRRGIRTAHHRESAFNSRAVSIRTPSFSTTSPVAETVRPINGTVLALFSPSAGPASW